MKPLTIGHLAREARINLETVRYYERRGLVPVRALRLSDTDLRAVLELHKLISRIDLVDHEAGVFRPSVHMHNSPLGQPTAIGADLKTVEDVTPLEERVASASAVTGTPK